MKKLQIRTGALLMAAFLGLELAGCGSLNQANEFPEETEEQVSQEYLLRYRLDKYEMSSGGQAVFFQEEDTKGFLALVNHKTGEEIPEEKQEDPDFINDGRYEIFESDLYHFNERGKRTLLRAYEPIPVPEEPEEVESYRSEVHPKAFRFAENGRILCVEQSYERWMNPRTNPQFHTRDRWFVRILDEKGAELSRAELENGTDGEGINCDSLVYLGNDLLAVSLGKRVLFFGTDGKERFSVSTPLPIQELCRIRPGTLAVLLRDSGKRWLSVIDTAERSASVPKEIPEGAHAFCAGEEEGHLYFIRNTEVFRLSLEDWGIERTASLLSIGVEPTSVASMFAREDGSLHFVLHEWDAESEETGEFYAIAEPVNEFFEGIVLRIGFRDISGSLKKAILRFNRDQTGICVEPIDYRNQESEAEKTEETELLVLDEAEYEKLLSEGCLAELGPMLEADPDYSVRDFFPAVWKALIAPDGSLRRLTSSFRIETMACDSDAVEGQTELSLLALREHLSEMERDASLYEPWYVSERLLRDLIAVNRYALGTEGSPDYDQGLYEELRIFSNIQPVVYDYNSYISDTSSMEKRIREGRLLLIQAHIATIQEFKWYDAFFESGASFPGWPTRTGSASQIRFDDCLAVSSFCGEAEREAAWEFFRMILDEEYASGCYGFPVRSAVMDKWLKEDAAAISYRVDEEGEYELDDDGEKIEQARRSWYSPEWRRHYEYAITDEQRGKLLELIESCV